MGRKEKHFGRFFAPSGVRLGFLTGAVLDAPGGPIGFPALSRSGKWRRDAAGTGRRGRLPYDVLRRIGWRMTGV